MTKAINASQFLISRRINMVSVACANDIHTIITTSHRIH